jgi:hypothetical protein
MKFPKVFFYISICPIQLYRYTLYSESCECADVIKFSFPWISLQGSQKLLIKITDVRYFSGNNETARAPKRLKIPPKPEDIPTFAQFLEYILTTDLLGRCSLPRMLFHSRGHCYMYSIS